MNWYCNLCLYQFRKLSLIATRVGLDDYYVTFPATIRKHILLSAEKLYTHTITIKTAVLATSIKLPTSEEMKNLSLADIAIAAGLADEFRDRLREYVHIDPYCVPDPFTDKDDCNYSVILDRKNLNRIVVLLANKKGTLPQLPWSDILGERLVKMSVSKEDALAIKHELMPKETYNFYPYRRNGVTTGYLMFAFQICG